MLDIGGAIGALVEISVLGEVVKGVKGIQKTIELGDKNPHKKKNKKRRGKE